MAHRDNRSAIAALAIAALIGLASHASAQPPAQRTPSEQTPEARSRLNPALAAMQFETASVTQNQSGKSQVYENVPMGSGDWYAPTGGVFSAKNLP